MRTPEPDDKVTVTVGGVEIEAVFHQVDPENDEYFEVVIDGLLFGVPILAVKSSSPWDEVGTVVRTEDDRLYSLNPSGVWRRLLAQTSYECHFDKDIAPHNPVRLIPEVTS